MKRVMRRIFIALLKGHYERQAVGDYDGDISRMLDCALYLYEAEGFSSCKKTKRVNGLYIGKERNQSHAGI